MTQEEIKLLLVDLSARLPYGVICKRYENAYELVDIDIRRGLVYLLRDEQYVPYSIISGDEVKPVLRSVSSMTEEEKEELEEFMHIIGEDEHGDYTTGVLEKEIPNYIDWLLQHHFDYRGLIPMGLAIEVTPENNPYNK